MKIDIAPFLQKVNKLKSRFNSLRLLFVKIIMGSFQPASRTEASLLNELFIRPGTTELTTQKIEATWKQSLMDMWLGDYAQSSERRFHLARSVSRKNLSDDFNFKPPLLHPEWGQAIGHLGHLGVYLRAQSRGLIGSKNSVLQIAHEDWLSSITLQTVGDLIPIEFRKLNSFISNLSTTWHLYDRIFCIKGLEDYTDVLKLQEKIFSSEVISEKNALFPQNDRISDSALRNLSRDQYSRLQQPYIAFHLRHKKSIEDPRICSPSNYEGVFEEAKAAGFQVVIFGDTFFEFGFSLDNNVIDLRSTKRDFQSVIPYLLHNSKGLITTHSGPAPLAWSFGKPVLVTNCIHIDYFVLAASLNSLYLPKIWIDKNGDVIPLRKVYGTRLGQWGWSQSHHLLNGARLQENSSVQLSLAAKHFLDGIKYGVRRDETMDIVDLIRFEKNSWGTGLISPSLFLGLGEKLLQ